MPYSKKLFPGEINKIHFFNARERAQRFGIVKKSMWVYTHIYIRSICITPHGSIFVRISVNPLWKIIFRNAFLEIKKKHNINVLFFHYGNSSGGD